MIALIFYAAKLIARNELEVSNFFIPCCNDVGLPAVRSLATLNIQYNKVYWCRRVLPVIDDVPTIKDKMKRQN